MVRRGNNGDWLDFISLSKWSIGQWPRNEFISFMPEVQCYVGFSPIFTLTKAAIRWSVVFFYCEKRKLNVCHVWDYVSNASKRWGRSEMWQDVSIVIQNDNFWLNTCIRSPAKHVSYIVINVCHNTEKVNRRLRLSFKWYTFIRSRLSFVKNENIWVFSRKRSLPYSPPNERITVHAPHFETHTIQCQAAIATNGAPNTVKQWTNAWKINK